MESQRAAIPVRLAPAQGDFVVRQLQPQQEMIYARRARRRLLINSATLLMSAAAAVIILHTAAREGGGGVDGAAPAYTLLAFFVLLLGVWLALLVPVAGQFPRAARVGVAVATVLCRR